MNKVATRLEQLETIISESLQSSGKALAEIHDKELFKSTHDTWESYCKDRWGYAKAYGYRLIANSKTMERVSTIVDSSDKLKVSHLSEISKAPEKQQAAITATVLERCESEGRAPTANDFKREVAPLVVKQEQTTPKPEPTPEPEPPDPKSEEPKDLVPKIYSAASRIDAMMKELKALANEIGGEWLDLTNITTQACELKHLIRSGAYWRDCPCGSFCKDCRKLGWLSAARKKFTADK